MRRLVGSAALLVPVLAFAAGAAGQGGTDAKSGPEPSSKDGTTEVGDKDRGHAYAKKFCTDCHAIEKDDNLLLGDIPTFQEVANSDGMSPRALVVWLRTSHPTMPNYVIPPDDIDDIVAYIMSLRRPKP